MSLTELSVLQQRAQKGDARAQAELGARLMFGRAAPYAPADGAHLLQAAVQRRDSYALQFMSVLAALGEGRPQSWTDALDFLNRAAAVGDKRAKEQLGVVGPPEALEQTWLRPPAAITHFEAQRISTVEGFISRDACDWIIDKARPALSEATIKNPEQGGANQDAMRTNTGMGFSIVDSDLVLQLIHARIAAALRLDVRQQEPTNILHYDPGQQYRPHFDFLDPGEAHFARELQQVGQRVATVLIYLNADYEGGETAFPRLDWAFKGKAGDALMFWNVTSDGQPDKQTCTLARRRRRGQSGCFRNGCATAPCRWCDAERDPASHCIGRRAVKRERRFPRKKERWLTRSRRWCWLIRAASTPRSS